MATVKLTHPLASSLAQCFYGYGRPTGAAIDRYFKRLQAPWDVAEGASNKEERVEALLAWVGNNCPDRISETVNWMVYDLHRGGHLDPGQDEVYVGNSMARNLTAQLAKQGLQVGDDGELREITPLAAGSLPASRSHVRAEISRLQRSHEDPAALLGHTKDLLETVAKTVIHETGGAVDDRLDYPQLLRKAREVLPLMPTDLEPASRAGKAMERFINGLWTMANSVNELRNAAGTGHGRLTTGPFGTAHPRAVADAAVALARLWLELLDQQAEGEP
ncbi:Abortive infection C-terminus [Nocardioides scoriae]|uniref:Abortive infection C-terminus n=1 Tax=Nocardioides scoriae TaxID=642780 RepID=A0A1H1VMA5_9ACTN|nr:abortive infection family protein [Nocardioides scoriae]SDS85660.1 Abortive infection C-terminus [Nocardioides scoriae]